MALHQGTLQIFENNVGVSDAVLLDPLTEDKFLENLQQRFSRQQIYVSLLFLIFFSLSRWPLTSYFNLPITSDICSVKKVQKI